MKKMLITFFDMKGIVHFELIPKYEAVNQVYFVEILKRLREVVRRKIYELLPPIEFSTMTIFQPTRHSLSSSLWPKNRLLKWDTHHFPLIWIRMTSGCLQSKVCLRGTKISG
jgi:hypothetical protein